MARKKTSKQKLPSKAKVHFKQLIVTLNDATGEVAKLEALGPGGRRQALPDAAVARLLRNDELNDLNEVLEDAYAAGVRDGIDDALSNWEFEGSGPSHMTEIDTETAGGHILRSGIRRFVLRRALRRGTIGGQLHARHNGTSGAR